MLKVTNNQIYLTRGDTAVLQLDIKNLDGRFYDSTQDQVIFRLKSSTASSKYLLEKPLEQSNNEVVLRLTEKDTCDLPIIKARYEIEVVTSQDEHYTVIENELFEIGPELENHG